MSLTTTVRSIPGHVVGAYLGAARVPLSVAARATGHAGDEAWAPLLRFEGVQAAVETALGSAVGDAALLTKGRLRQEKLDRLYQAATLEAVAEQERRAADREFQQRREEAEAKRVATERQAREQEQRLAQQAQRAERAAAERAARKKAGAREIKAAQDKAIAAQERDAKLAALDREAEALAATEQALDAAETVEVIEDTLEGTQENRRSG